MARNKVQGFRAFLSDYLPESWVRCKLILFICYLKLIECPSVIMEAERVGAPLQPPAEEEAHDGNDFSLLNSLSHVGYSVVIHQL